MSALRRVVSCQLRNDVSRFSHSREGGNPGDRAVAVDSRLRGNDIGGVLLSFTSNTWYMTRYWETDTNTGGK